MNMNKNHVFVIAEAGVNHNGDVILAKKLIDLAAEAGADAVKFQTFSTEENVTQSAPKASYQKKTSLRESQFDMLRKLELSQGEFREIFDYCKYKKILFLSTPFDYASADFLARLPVSLFKISSGEITNVLLLKKVAEFKKPIILSTGMSSLEEVKQAVKLIYLAGNKKLTLLHCTSNYPTKFEDVNLRAIQTLRHEFNVPVGYSDHTEGIEVAIAATALGAEVIEKHFTLDKNLPGPDHKASLSPTQLKDLVRSIRNVEISMGDGRKVPRPSENNVKQVARKSVVSLFNIKKGERIKAEMLGLKRPGTGLAPKKLAGLLDKVAKRDISKDTIVKSEDFK